MSQEGPGAVQALDSSEVVLVFDGKKLTVNDFREFALQYLPEHKFPMPREIMVQLLDQFRDHKLLLHIAMDSQEGKQDISLSVSQELGLVHDFLSKLALSRVNDFEAKLKSLFEKQFTERRFEIQSVYFKDKEVANANARQLRRNPGGFAEAMEEHNTEGMKKNDIGQGIVSMSQLPPEYQEALADQRSPGVVGPIEITNGYMVVRVVRLLDPPSFEEKRGEIEHIFMTQKRNEVREELLQSLRKDASVQYYPEKVLNAPEFTLNSMNDGE